MLLTLRECLTIKEFKADTIVNLAILSARGESMLQTTWKVNVDGVVTLKLKETEC